MNQLTEIKFNLPFLSKTYGLEKEIREHIWELYLNGLDNSEYIAGRSILPTKFVFLKTAMSEFVPVYIDYVLNGYGGSRGEDIRWRLEAGEDQSDIMDELVLEKDYTDSYGVTLTEDELEDDYLEDVKCLMEHYRLSFIDDCKEMNVFSSQTEDNGWLNCPIKSVF